MPAKAGIQGRGQHETQTISNHPTILKRHPAHPQNHKNHSSDNHLIVARDISA